VKRKLALGIVLLAIASSCFGASDASEAAPSGKEAKIRALLRRTGSARMAVQMIDQMIATFRQTMPEVPGAFWDEFRNEVRTEDLEAMIVPIYDRHYEESDIQALLDFFDTAAGRKMLKETPGILTESMDAGKKWGQGIAEKIIERLRKRGYKTNA